MILPQTPNNLPGRNVISTNYFGIVANYYGYLNAGTNPNGGYNSICNNTSYDVSASYNSIILAQNNWWGVYPPNTSKFYSNQSTLDYSYSLSYDPNAFLLKRGNEINSISGSPFLDDDLIKAGQFQNEGKYEDAIIIYKKVFEKEKNTAKAKYSLIKIEECYSKSNQSANFAIDITNKIR